MPIFRTPRGLCYFADVPGCLGAAMIRYLEGRFGSLAFHDAAHTEAAPAQRWSRTSPQHVGRKTLKRLFPPDFFMASFAIVCHPADRLGAVYAFQRDVEGAIPASTGFGEWLEDIAERMVDEPFVFDNAVRPMVDLVPEGAEVFRLEDGLDDLVTWLDRQAGVEGPALQLPAVAGGVPEPSWFDLDRIAEIYAADYVRFGYGKGEGAAPRPHLFGARRR